MHSMNFLIGKPLEVSKMSEDTKNIIETVNHIVFGIMALCLFFEVRSIGERVAYIKNNITRTKD